LRAWQKEMLALRLIANSVNCGKGWSVRTGMLAARGEIALFTDADLSAPIEEAEKLLHALRSADVAIGSTQKCDARPLPPTARLVSSPNRRWHLSGMRELPKRTPPALLNGLNPEG
jgi:glycosyltransferase involved in cell wall biosynthesis